MRVAAVIAFALLSFRALAECTPASPKVIAEAERRASDADHKAQQAESVAVRSGNPGAQARADLARADASAAREELAKLKCQSASGTPGPKLPSLSRPGY